MNIIHNTTQKYVPNRLFDSLNGLQNDDYSHQKKEGIIQSEQNVAYKSQNKKAYKRPSKFKDRTNIIVKDNAKQLKNTQGSPLLSTQLNIKLKIPQQTNEQQDFKEYVQIEKYTETKTKKKVSPKKKNLRKLFLEIEQKTQDNVIVEEQGEQKLSEQVIFQTSNEQVLNDQSLKQGHVHLKQKVQNENDNAQNSNLNLFPSTKKNRFSFLHNQINFDSSSSEDESQNQQKSLKRSQSSQNEAQKISFQLPKIKSRNKFFMKNEDFDEDSEQSDNQKEHKQTESVSQMDREQLESRGQTKRGETQLNQQQKKRNNLVRVLTVTQFRRQFVSAGEQYLKKQLPHNTSVQLVLRRDKSKRLSQYVQYLIHDAKSLNQLVVIRKKSSGYQINAKSQVQNPKVHPDLKYLTARLQTSFLGNQFNLKYISGDTKDKHIEKQELAATVSYQTNILGLSGPRKISIYIPESQSGKYYGQKSLQALYQKRCMHRIQKYTNKQAKWNQDVQSYVLNLKGKARLSSVKNFVIIKDSTSQKVQNQHQNRPKDQKSHVVFGKINKDLFNLVVSSPFSILQGVSIALSTFDRKLTCQ